MGAIYDKAAGFASNNILSVGEMAEVLGDVLKDGKIQYGEKGDIKKIKDEFGDLMTRPARIALARFEMMGDAFEPNLAGTIFGVNDQMGEKFEAAGVMSAIQLLKKAKTGEDRHQLATSFGMSLSKVIDVTERADLARTLGVGKTYAAVLEKVGVRNIQQLANQNVNELHGKIKEFSQTDEGKDLFNRRPSKKAVEKWIDNAAALPYMIQLSNEDSIPFSKWAFDKLENHLKARLLFGSNVELPKGQGIFDASGVSSSSVSADTASVPQAVKNALADIEANPPPHPDWESDPSDEAELVNLREVQVGDKTIGYTATFDVATEHAFHYEGAGVGQDGSFEMTYAFDTQGKKLAEDAVYW